MERLDASSLERYDSIFVGPHGDDVMLACPARMQSEGERGRRVLAIAMFEPVGSSGKAAQAAHRLGAAYVAAGLPPARERAAAAGGAVPAGAPTPQEEELVYEAARLLASTIPHAQPQHIFAPLGLGPSPDHALTYEACLRAFANESGRNLFLYEERPEAFVPGAVRTRLALLGARLPPAAQRAAEQASLWRHLLSLGEPRRLRGERAPLRERLAAMSAARRRYREARPWNPLRAFGPRLQPVVHVADDDARRAACAIAEELLPVDRRGRPRAAQRFNARARAVAKKLGGVYHVERLWLVLPSGDGLPEIQHPLDHGRG